MGWFEDLMQEINTMNDDLARIGKQIGLHCTTEELRESYERGEIETAQSISAQKAMGNKKAGM